MTSILCKNFNMDLKKNTHLHLNKNTQNDLKYQQTVWVHLHIHEYQFAKCNTVIHVNCHMITLYTLKDCSPKNLSLISPSLSWSLVGVPYNHLSSHLLQQTQWFLCQVQTSSSGTLTHLPSEPYRPFQIHLWTSV